jgi:RNA polymerase sigma factor (sigma-70 family)
MSTRDDVTGTLTVMPHVAKPSPASERTHVQQLLAALGGALARSAADPDLLHVFEHEVRQLFSMRLVRLREIPARYQARLVTPTRTSDSVVLGVPTANPQVQAVLEASCEPDRTLDDFDLELLTAIAQVGGLVLEAARARTPMRVRPNEHRATPMIGSTRVIETLRERIERVAQAVAQLSEADREVLLMRHAEDMPYEEIACLLDIEPAAARKRYGRALIRLQRVLAEHGLLEGPP